MPKRKNRAALFVAMLLATMLAFSLVPALGMAEATDGANEEPIPSLANNDTSPDDGEEVVKQQDDVDSSPVATNTADASGSAIPASNEQEVISAQDDVIDEDVAVDEVKAQTAEDSTLATEATGDVHVTYTGHVQRKGWMPWVKDGDMAGTQGEGLRVEALKIKLDKSAPAIDGGIEYCAHVQGKGWMPWVKDGDMAGTQGESKRVEAIKIKLYGAIADQYDVYYSVHAQRKGWMAWATNGDPSGTASQSLRLEAVRIVLVKKNGGSAPSNAGINYNKPFDPGPILRIQAHVQRLGWLNPVDNGAVAGTTGQSLRMEALQLTTPGLDVPGGVMIDGHVQGKGWTGYNTNGLAGSVGEGKRLEAIKIKLHGTAESKYDIYYRVHVSHIGWLGWAMNGQEAGTAGMSARVEAIQVMMVADGQTAPSDDGSIEPFITGTNLLYNAFCQSYGWRGEVESGATAGTTGQGKRLEALSMRLSGGTIGGSITYNSYVANSGWQGWRADNLMSGTNGESRGIEGFQVKLSGRAATMYDVYYRAHIATAGWLGWAKNGETAGAPGSGTFLQAYQVRLVPKGNGAPGSTANHEVNKAWIDNLRDPYVGRAQGYSSPTGWLILVDTNSCWLSVYRGSRGNWNSYDRWRVTTGKPSTPSVRGVWAASYRTIYFQNGTHRCWYATSWNGPYMFHSVIYDANTDAILDGRLGEHLSAGCVRMTREHAKWIYDVIPGGTTVVVF